MNKSLLKWTAILLGCLIAVVAIGILLAIWQAGARLDRTWQVEVKHVPMPFPGPPGTEPAMAMQQAIERGRHYVDSRGACRDCHGEDLAGGIIADNPVTGRWVAPNITHGGITRDYSDDDWVRIIRHGIKQDGTAATMPSLDFTNFSDQEISDIATYIRSVPPIDKEMPASTLGPMFAILIMTGDRRISAEHIDHEAERPVYPPAMKTSLALGEHLANVCRGCHGPTLGGGTIPDGNPSWPPAANLTFDESGLAGWSLEDFDRAMRSGIRPDGRKLDPIMPMSVTSRMKPVEIESLYNFLKTVPPKPMGSR